MWCRWAPVLCDATHLWLFTAFLPGQYLQPSSFCGTPDSQMVPPFFSAIPLHFHDGRAAFLLINVSHVPYTHGFQQLSQNLLNFSRHCAEQEVYCAASMESYCACPVPSQIGCTGLEPQLPWLFVLYWYSFELFSISSSVQKWASTFLLCWGCLTIGTF